MNIVRQEIAKNLLFYRKKNKLTQKELANYLDVKNSAVSNWEKGLNSIDIDTLHKACKVFNISISDMFGVYSNTSNEIYSLEEKTIISNFRELNEDGQEKLIDYAEDLVSTNKYKKHSQSTSVSKKQA